MRSMHFLLAASLLAVSATACGSSSQNNPGDDAGVQSGGDAQVQNTDGAAMNAATCADPIRLETAAMRDGMTLVYEGTTEGRANNLRPYAEAMATDSTEAVLQFRVPEGMTNVKISTEGSDFDTTLYVRDACSQVMGGADLGYSDNTPTANPEMDATHSTIYLTNLTPGQVRFIIVDGHAMGEPASGRFRLTIAPFTPGTAGNPCGVDAMGMGTCMGGLRCSGANVCVNTVGTGAMCDPRGINNTCAPNQHCVNDPTPPAMGANPMVCALPGTRAGAPCRESGTSCDAPLVCNDAMGNPVCVRRVGREQPCDPMGLANRCEEGLTCRTVAGASFCEGMATTGSGM